MRAFRAQVIVNGSGLYRLTLVGVWEITVILYRRALGQDTFLNKSRILACFVI